MAGAAATRDIVFRLKAQADPGAKAAMDAFARNALNAQQTIDAAVEKSGQKKAAAAELYNGKSLAYWAKYSREIDVELKKQSRAVERAAAQQLKAQERAAKDATKAAEREYAQQVKAGEKAAADQLKAIERGAKDAEKAAVRSAKAQQKATREAAKAQKEAAAQVASANQRMSAGFDKASEGIIKLGRGLAMSGMIGEENLQKLTDGLLKVQAASDLVRGGKDLIQGVSAMSSAGTAAGAAGGGGIAAGVGAVAAPALAAAAALASVALAATVAAEAWNGTADKAGSVSDSIGLMQTGIIGWVDSLPGVAATVDFLRPVMSDFATEMVDASRGARDSAAALTANAEAAKKAAADREMFDKSTASAIRSNASQRAGQQHASDIANRFAVERSGTGLTDNDKAGLLNEQARIDAAKEIQATEAAIVEAKKAGLQSQKLAGDDHMAALERALALQYEGLAIVKQEKAERIATMREQLAMQTQLSDKAMASAKELANANKSDYQRFADLDVEQKKQLNDIVKNKLDKGQSLTKEEADLAGGFNEFKDRVGANRASVGAAADSPFQLFHAGNERAARAAERAGEQQDKKLKISSDINVVIENKMDEQAIIAAMQPIIQKTMEGQKNMEDVARREVAAGARGRGGQLGSVVR